MLVEVSFENSGGGGGFLDRWWRWVCRLVVLVDFQFGGDGGGFSDQWW